MKAQNRIRSGLLDIPFYCYFFFIGACVSYIMASYFRKGTLLFWVGNILVVAGLVFMATVMLKRRHAYKLLESIETEWRTATIADTVSEFIIHYDQLLDELSSFEKHHKPYVKYLNGFTLDVAEDTFQWRLREAIARETTSTLSLIKREYAYNNERKRGLYAYFVDEIKKYQNRFLGEETWDLLKESLEKVYRASGSEVNLHYSLFLEPDELLPSLQRTIPDDSLLENTDDILLPTREPVLTLEGIDGMEGHKFEYWCANLLRNNGFQDVSVTPGSGDQGIDITAVKEGVKYAFQCKNYSGQVGNSAVQEAHAGKSFYDCHVAVVITNSTFTSGAKALAKKTGVLLWDREKISSMLS